MCSVRCATNAYIHTHTQPHTHTHTHTITYQHIYTHSRTHRSVSSHNYDADSDVWDPRRQNPGTTGTQSFFRMQLDPLGGGEEGLISLEELATVGDLCADFLDVHPDRDGMPTRFVYAAAVSYEGLGFPFDSVIKMDLEVRRTRMKYTYEVHV